MRTIYFIYVASKMLPRVKFPLFCLLMVAGAFTQHLGMIGRWSVVMWLRGGVVEGVCIVHSECGKTGVSG